MSHCTIPKKKWLFNRHLRVPTLYIMRPGKTIINVAFLMLLEISGFLHLREGKAFPPPQKTNKPTLFRKEGRGVLFVLSFNHSRISSFG